MEVSLQFFYAEGSGVFPQSPNDRVDSRENVAGNFVQLFLSLGVENNFVSHMRLAPESFTAVGRVGRSAFGAFEVIVKTFSTDSEIFKIFLIQDFDGFLDQPGHRSMAFHRKVFQAPVKFVRQVHHGSRHWIFSSWGKLA